MKAKFLALAALVLGLASCQTEPEGFDVVLGGEVDATICVEIPEAETRAMDSAQGIFGTDILDGDATMRYILEIYHNGELAKERQVLYSDDPEMAFPVRLVPGRAYDFVVWADVVTDEDAGDNHYFTEGGLTNITLNGEWKAMDETRDAFTGVMSVAEFSNSSDISFDLIRPFAKLRVRTTDIEDVLKLGIDPTTAIVEYTTDHRQSFNARKVEYGAANLADKTQNVNYTEVSYEDMTAVDTYTLFADYFFADNDIVNFTLDVKDAAGQTIGEKITFNTAINVRRNYLTTITGNLLTDANNVNVEIKPGFGGSFDEEYTPVRVRTAQELQSAISDAVNGEETIIVLNENIDLSDLLTRAADPSLTVAAGKVIFIDLNGKTLTSTSVATGANYNMFDVRGTLTIKNGTITTKHEGNNMGWNNSTNVFNITAGGILNLDGVTAKNLGGSDMAFVAHLNNWGEVTLNVNNSTLESTYIAVRVFNSGYDMNNVTIENSTLKGKYCFWVHNYKAAGDSVGTDETLNVDIYNNGNTFVYTNDAPVLYGFANPIYFNEYGDEYVANGVGMADGNYVVYNAEGMLWVAEQVNSDDESFNGKTIVLGADIDLAGQSIQVAAGKTLTLDLNGKTLSATETATGSFGLITNKGNLTVKNGTMTLKAVNNRGWNAYSSVISNNPGGNLVVENATIEHLGGTDMAYGIDNLTNGRGTSAVATINEGAVVKSVYRAVRQFLNGTEATNSLTVNAGAVIEGANKSIWMQDPSANANTGTLVVNEGATLKGDAYLTVTAGSTEWPVSVSIADSTLSEQSQVLYTNVPSGYGVILEDGIWKVVKNGVNNYVLVSNADELVALSATGVKPGAKVFVLADIDLTGKEFNGLQFDNTNWANRRLFDGQGHTISNWSYEGGAEDMGFIRQWVGEVRNFRLENCHLKTDGRSAIVAGKIYGDISDVEVANCSIDDSYWACGAIAGLYNAGDITNCTVTNTTVKSNGGTGGIVGVINEEGGLRAVRNCSVTNSTINNTGIYGEVYSGGGIVGMFNTSGPFEITDCTVSNNTLEGGYIYEICPEDENLTIE